MMIFFRTICFVSLLLVMACQRQPVAKWPILLPENEMLGDAEKIKILTSNTTSFSSSKLAAIAQLYENQELYQSALTIIEDAIELDPLNSSYHAMKADYAFRLNNKSMAYSASITAYQLGSKTLKQRLKLAKMAVALSEFRIVGEMIDTLLIVYPQDPNVLYLAARKYEKEGKYALARASYEQVYSSRPDNIENNYYFSRFLVSQREFTRAKEVATSDVLSENRQSYYLLAEIYHGLEYYDSAAIWYQKSLRFANDTATYSLAIKNYAQGGLQDSVLSLSKLAVNDHPENRHFLTLVAGELNKRRMYDEAMVYYLTLYQLDTTDTLVEQELEILQRKIAYLQRRKRDQKKLADSLAKVLPVFTF